MAKTYFLDDGAASHSIDDGSGIIIGTTLLAASALGSGTLDFTIPNASSRKRFFEENQDLDVTRASSGTLSVEVNVTVAFADHTGFVRAHRVNSSGAIQATDAETAGQSFGTTGIKTFSPAITGLGTWASTDRLVIEIRVANANAHGGDDVSTITVGTTDAEVVASNFIGPPAISSATMADSGRDWSAPHQDISITFGRAMEKSGGAAYNVGDTISGLTVDVNGLTGQAVTYRSGDSTATWVVRVAQLVQQNDSLLIDYARASGEIVADGGGSELLDTTDFAATNSLTKRIRETLKRGDTGAAITTAVDILVLDAEPRDADDAAWAAVLQRHPNVTPDGTGLIDIQASDASLVVGDPVYLVIVNPREDSSGASTMSRSAFAVALVQ